MTKRMLKDHYLLELAKSAAARSTCPDLQVGCIIATEDGHALSMGYNGRAHGEKHCRVGADGKCLDNGPDHNVVHAEVNAVCHAAKHGIRLDGAVAYVTHKPCARCAAVLKQAGIKKVITK